MKNQVINKLVSKEHFGLALLIFIFLIGTQDIRAQDSRMNAINSKRIAFLSERMSVTPDEARQFWPVYNEYNQKRDAQANAHREKWSGKEVSEMTQEEASRYAEDQVSYVEQSAAIKREYYEKLKRILPVKKIALLYEAERDFNKMLFREARLRGRDDEGSGR